MTVIVVNCSPWPNFPSLIRTRALDLYPKDASVEFWHAHAPLHDSDAQVWGDWPKCFGEPLWIMRDELEDIVSSHITGPVAPLVLIVVFDAGGPSRPQPATATVLSAMDFIANKIAADSDRAPEIRRSLWRIAAVCDFSGQRRMSRAAAAAEAWDLVKLRSRPTPVDEVAIESESFDTAVLIDGGLGNNDEGIFAGLRVLIDMVRDQRVRDVLKPGRSRGPRVIKLTTPRVGFDPADRVLITLDTLVDDYEASPERDEAADPLNEPVRTLQEKIARSEEHLLCAAAEAVVKRSKPDPNIEDTLRKYFDDSPPELPDLADSRDVKAAANVLQGARDRLGPFLDGRHRRLREMRRDQVWSIQEYGSLLSRVEGAAIDHSLGQSGEVLTAIGTALDALNPLQQDYVKRAEKCRQSLNDEYCVEFAAARAHRRDQPLLSDFNEVGEFDTARTRLIFLFENSVSSSRFMLGWLLLTVFYCLTASVSLYMTWRGSWTWPMTLLATSILVPASVSAIWLLLQWRQLRKALNQASTKVHESYKSTVAHIDNVTRLALAHLAGSRVAGCLKPFTRTLICRQQDLLDLKSVTQRIFDVIRQDSEKRLAAIGGVRPPRDASLKNKLVNANPQDWLKLVLSEMTQSEPHDVEVISSGGELTGALAFQTPLRIVDQISLAFVPAPSQAPDLSNSGSSKAPPISGPESPPKTDRPSDPEVVSTRTARKPKRDKRPSV
jgi:hypothetical protein